MSMHISESNRQREIDSLKYRIEIKDLLLNRMDVGDFNSYFQLPESFYTQGYPEKPGDWPSFKERKLLPLWEHEGKIFALDLATKSNDVISFYVECSDDITSYNSIDQAIFEIKSLHVWEFGGEKEEAMQAIAFAKSVNLPCSDELSKMLNDHMECTEAQINEYIQKLA